MRIINYNSKNCLDLKDEYGNVPNFSLLITAESGHGKGMSMEAIAERWRKTTGGVTIFLNDPKQESEQSFVQYEPQEIYHLKELKKDGIKKNTYPCKLYHPFTFSLAKKGYLPKIEFYSISIKSLVRDDWSILAETDSETETIKLLERVSEYLPRNASLFDFLLEVERFTEGNKENKKSDRDKKNWGLKGGGGTAKSIKQIGNMLSSFSHDYFLRKDICELKLDFEKILLDTDNYHIFLTNWINNPKTRNFLVVYLLGQFVKNAQRLSDSGKMKKPVLFLIPELNAIIPDESKGSSLFLAKALRKHLITFRSKGAGMSCLADCQIWSQVHPAGRGAFKETFYGKLNPEDARIIFKAKSYTSDKRNLFEQVEENYCSYVWDGKEDYGVIHIFMPSHMHKEEKYNWIQMWKKNKLPVERYDNLVNKMRKEFEQEEQVIDTLIEKESKIEEEKKEEKESKKDKIEEPKKEKKDSQKEYLMKRAWELHNDGISDRKIAEELGSSVKSHKTAKKYYLNYEKLLKEKEKENNNPERIKPYLGAGIMPEEIEDNFDIGNIPLE